MRIRDHSHHHDEGHDQDHNTNHDHEPEGAATIPAASLAVPFFAAKWAGVQHSPTTGGAKGSWGRLRTSIP